MSKDFHLPDGRALVVGLGNPGPKYEATRHNIGFMVVEELARRWSVSLAENRFKALLGSGTCAGRQVTILEPQTYMNLSGESVQAAARFFRLTPASIVVAHDDIDLLPGVVKLKVGGGHGGHNGLRSCDQHLSTKDYVRVRLGIGRPPHPQADVSGWVLGRFGGPEQPVVEHLVERGADAIEIMLSSGLLEAQGRIHPLQPPSVA